MREVEVKKKKLFEYTIEDLRKMVSAALRIDSSSEAKLDREIKEQSERHADWIFMSGLATKLLAVAKLDLKTVTAEAIRDIRENTNPPLPKTYPVEKELVPLRDDWKAAYRRVLELQEYVDVLTALEKTWNNRTFLLIRLARNMEGGVEPRVYSKRDGVGDVGSIKMEEYDLE